VITTTRYLRLHRPLRRLPRLRPQLTIVFLPDRRRMNDARISYCVRWTPEKSARRRRRERPMTRNPPSVVVALVCLFCVAFLTRALLLELRMLVTFFLRLVCEHDITLA
jgi:hypothetical protein